jgi:electron transfer flavoprotein alpha subunit
MFALRALRPSRLNARAIATSRLLSTLTILEHRGGKVSSASLPAVTAASKLGGPVTAFVAGGDSASVAAEAAKISGISKVLHVPNGAYDKVPRRRPPPAPSHN